MVDPEVQEPMGGPARPVPDELEEMGRELLVLMEELAESVPDEPVELEWVLLVPMGELAHLVLMEELAELVPDEPEWELVARFDLPVFVDDQPQCLAILETVTMELKAEC